MKLLSISAVMFDVIADQFDSITVSVVLYRYLGLFAIRTNNISSIVFLSSFDLHPIESKIFSNHSLRICLLIGRMERSIDFRGAYSKRHNSTLKAPFHSN